MKRERRLLIGKQLREGSLLSAPDCMKKCGVGYTCACNWRGGTRGIRRARKAGEGQANRGPGGRACPVRIRGDGQG
ncbi:MAG: hypothetical protein PUJ43_04115 [Bacillales bacterium]|nr:hypothetical protein [Bacillales bacterium]MDY5919743.1 hypothetical protein [Candidatus Enteromonas sp.]